MTDEKRCRKCNEWKPLSEFTERRDKPGAYSPACKACDGAKKREQADRQRAKQRTPLRQTSEKRKAEPKKARTPNAYEVEFRKMRPAIEKRSKGMCEAQTEKCVGAGKQVHHRKLRSQGGSNSEVNLLYVCFPCHEWIHAHPKTSYERGWLIRGSADETPYRH